MIRPLKFKYESMREMVSTTQVLIFIELEENLLLAGDQLLHSTKKFSKNGLL